MDEVGVEPTTYLGPSFDDMDVSFDFGFVGGGSAEKIECCNEAITLSFTS